MTPIRRELLDSITHADRYDRSPAELRPLRLEAARELFKERIEQIPVLRRRAQDSGVREGGHFADLVPLLFSHTLYKSYPVALVEQGEWDRLLQWLMPLSLQGAASVDMTGLENIDGWNNRLRAAAHMI